MKFSIIYEAQMVDTSRANEAQVFQDIVEQSVYAEEMGFDVIWSVEHHSLTQYAHLSAPESFLAFIAGRTTRIHVGHGVICLPFKMNHPIKVAERVATLDILSRGRLHFGVGKGGTRQETGAFDTPMELVTPQVDEAMYMIPKMWLEGDFEYHSELIDIPPRPIHPKPFQDPHPPMYMACTREDALLVAGARGLGALVLGFSGPDEIAKKNSIYRKAFRERKLEDQVGFRPTEHLAALCPAIIMESIIGTATRRARMSMISMPNCWPRKSSRRSRISSPAWARTISPSARTRPSSTTSTMPMVRSTLRSSMSSA
jgi:alkanesulfonate monooxygenase SsuD/methylene tetrahydromethanopterin reductase-like flavin-dependent oxidoreductase (luciferase family)